MPCLEALPNEVILEIAQLLSFDQRANLGRTCRRINALIESLLWTDIELHQEGYHESRKEIKDPPPFKAQRVYLACNEIIHYPGPHSQLDYLQHLLETDKDRLGKVASRVKSLCATIVSYDKIWDLLPHLSNLEALELQGSWDELDGRQIDEIIPEVDHAPLASLRFAKLVGYLPRAGARWILRSSPTLERLELGMLEENLAEDGDSSDYGSLDHEQTYPRPLGGFLPDEGVSMPNLRHLYLCGPAHRDHTDVAQAVGWSSRAEEASSDDWMSILMASRQTLQTLVLEHRLAVLGIEGDTWDKDERLRHFHEDNDGAGASKLADVLEAVGVHKTEEFPELSRVYLYGIVVRRGLEKRPSEERLGGRLMQLLEKRGVKCEARRGKWFTFEGCEGWTRWAEWDGESESSVNSWQSESHMEWDELIASV